MDDQNIDDLEEPQIVPHVAVSTRQIIRAGQFILNEVQYLLSIQKLRLFPSALWLVIFAETIIIAGFILQRILRVLSPFRDRRYMQILRRSENSPVATLLESQYILYGRRFRLSWWRLLNPVILYILICMLSYQISSLQNIVMLMYDPKSIHYATIKPYHPMKDICI